MSIIRKARPAQNFYVLDNRIINDARLSWAARGLLVYLLARPDNWKVSVAALVNVTKDAGKHTGRDGVYNLLAELEGAGYVSRQQGKGSGGKFGSFDYLVSEAPLTEKPEAVRGQPLTDSPVTAAPVTAKTTQVNTDSSQYREEPNTDGCAGGADAPASAPTGDLVPSADNGKAARAATWAAYANAYSARYGVEPIRNASVNGKVAQIVARLGEHAPAVAEYFLGSNAAYYVQRGHQIGLLLADAEKLYTEWATGRRVTATAARQAEQTQTNFDNAADALAMLRARREGKGE